MNATKNGIKNSAESVPSSSSSYLFISLKQQRNREFSFFVAKNTSIFLFLFFFCFTKIQAFFFIMSPAQLMSVLNRHQLTVVG